MNGQYKGIRARSLLVAAAVAAVLAPVQLAQPAEVDTSEWKCKSCPFPTGGDLDVRLGAADVSGSEAKFQDYTGLDDGTHVIADLNGQIRTESGWYADYEGNKLGLDSRNAGVRIGKEGHFSAVLSYDAIPKRTYDDTVTPFQRSSSGEQLLLPSGWVRGNTTAGMTALGTMARPVDIEHDRETAGVGLAWRLSKSFDFFANFSQMTRDGNKVDSAGHYTAAEQFAQPIDETTDSYEFGLLYTGARSHLRLAYAVQKYDNELGGLTWDNPYVAFNGATTGRMALAPDNESKQLILTAGMRLALDTTLGFRAVWGDVSQDAALLPYTTNATLSSPGALPRASLDGERSVTHYALTLSSAPFPRVRVRGAARYDESEDGTRELTFANGYVESDLGRITGSYTRPQYDFERMQGEIEGEYDLWKTVRVFVGARGEEQQRTEQDVDKVTEGTGYSGIRMAPLAGVSLVLRIGESHRDAADARTPDPGENPSLWKYQLANRDRDFVDVKLAWSATETVTLAIDGQGANDAYRRSPLGLQDGNDRRIAGTISWAPADGLSMYLDGGYQTMEARQTNAAGSPAAEWSAEHEDSYKTIGAGFRWTGVGGKWDFVADYSQADSEGDITVTNGPAAAFPRNETKFRSYRVGVAYKVSEALRLGVSYRNEKLESADWALQGVEPATMPALLALGADPYDYDANVIAFTVRYNFGAAKAASTKE